MELRPYPEQEPFLRTDKKYYAFVSGVGAGKTVAGIIRCIANVEQWNPGEMGAIVAPTTTMIKDVILPEMRELGLLDHWTYKSAHTDEPGLHAPNGSRVLILSANNRRTIERLRGLNLAWWWIDEKTEVPRRAQQILQQRLRVGNYRNGFVTTTPKGFDDTYDFFVGDVDGEMKEYGEADIYEADDRLSLLRVPTHANPHTPDDFKEQMDKDHEGQTYEQEVLDDFTKFEGLVYSWFNNDQHVIEHDALLTHLTKETRKGTVFDVERMVYGVDWGFSNPATIVALAIRHDGIYVVDEFSESRVTDDEHAEHAIEMQERWLSGPFFCDPSEPSNIEKFTRKGIDAQKADNSVTPGIQSVSSLSNDLRVSETCANLINEFGQYRYKDGGNSEDVVKQNDHLADALRYAVVGASQFGGHSVGVQSGDLYG